MTRDEIYGKVRDILIDRLSLDDDEVSPESSLIKDLGAESIDFLDIKFELERAFGFKIADGELFPDNVARDPKYVKDGKVTPEGMAELKAKLPHIDFSAIESDPQVTKFGDVFTVDMLVSFVDRKLKAAA